MAKDRTRGRLTIRKTWAAEPMPAEELAAAERLLARLVARAFAADHPELFGKSGEPGATDPEPPPAARGGAGAAD